MKRKTSGPLTSGLQKSMSFLLKKKSGIQNTLKANNSNENYFVSSNFKEIFYRILLIKLTDVDRIQIFLGTHKEVNVCFYLQTD